MKTALLNKLSKYKFVLTIVLPVLVVAAALTTMSSCDEQPDALFVAQFTGTPTTVEAGQTVTFTNQSTKDGFAYFTGSEWSFPGGAPSTSMQEDSVTVVYSTPGTYSVTLTSHGETETKTDYITVTASTSQAPVAEFAVSAATIDEGADVSYTDQSTNAPTSWAWTFEGGSPASSTDQNPTGITYATQGTYDVTLIATNAEGNDTETKVDYITVNAPLPFCSPVTDIDGNVYQVVDLGGSCWMAENLKTTKYKNGDVLNTPLDSAGWVNTSVGAYTHVGGNASNNAVYGKLYNGYAIFDSRGICPEGWHPATQPEWNALIASQGGENLASGALRTTTGWALPNTGATNSSGFSALPAGVLTVGIGQSFEYVEPPYQAYFWMATSDGPNTAPNVLMHNGGADLFISGGIEYLLAMSCRCVKD